MINTQLRHSRYMPTTYLSVLYLKHFVHYWVISNSLLYLVWTDTGLEGMIWQAACQCLKWGLIGTSKDQSFSVAAAPLQNNWPLHIRQTSPLFIFKTCLKTHFHCLACDPVRDHICFMPLCTLLCVLLLKKCFINEVKLSLIYLFFLFKWMLQVMNVWLASLWTTKIHLLLFCFFKPLVCI